MALSPLTSPGGPLFSLPSAVSVNEQQIFSSKQVGLGKRGERGLRPYKLRERVGWYRETANRRYKGKERTSCVSAAVRFAPGSGDQEAVDQANCMFQPGCVCHLPPLPPGSRPLRRPLLLSCVRRQGTRVGTGVPSGSGGADSREAGGLNAQSPRGPSSLGNSFPLFLPPLPFSLLHYYKGILQAS